MNNRIVCPRNLLAAAVLACLASSPRAGAGTAIWSGATSTNWSAGGNWSGGTGTGGVPAAGDDVIFGNTGSATTISAISNYVDSTSGNFLGTISSLQYTNFVNNTFQNTLIAPGLTLNVTGSTGPFGSALFVGTATAGGAAISAFGSISGPGAALNVNNTNANIVLSLSGSSSALGTLVMTNLDTFTANVSKIAIGDFLFGIGTAAAQGSLILARTNTITTSYVNPLGYSNPYGSNSTMETAIQLGVGSSSTLGGINAMMLGVTNAIFTDSISVASVKSGGSATTLTTVGFSPVFTNSNPTAYFRGVGGSATSVSYWGVGDTAIASGSSAAAFGKVDFSGGTVDILVNSMILGRDREGSAALDSGTFTFTAGKVNINNLEVGDQGAPATGSAVSGAMTVNGPAATLTVNSTLELGHTTLTTSVAANTKGILNIFNGTVNASNVIVGVTSSSNSIFMTNGTLVVSNSLATNASGLFVLAMTNSTLGLPVTADGSSKVLVQTLTTGAGTNFVQLASVPIFSSYPTQFALIKYTTALNGAGYNFALANIPATAPGAQLVNNTANHSIDLLLPASPLPVITGAPSPYSGSPGNNVSTNFSVIISASSVTPLGYQWYYTNAGTTIPLSDGPGPSGVSTLSGSLSNELQISDAQINDSGDYFVVITNVYGSATSTPVLLTISASAVPPSITGPNSPTVIQGNNATFTATVSGSPVPVLQWLDQNGNPISGANTSTLVITNVQYSQNGYTYSLVASNSAGSMTNSGTLTVIVPPFIVSQPASVVVTNTQGASLSVSATGVPSPSFQWFKNNVAITTNATGTTSNLVIGSASPADTASYFVQVSNSAGTSNSITATITVNSTMAETALAPSNGATGICYDTPLYITFNQPPVINNNYKIRIYNVTNGITPVDTIDLSQNTTAGVQAHSAFPGDSQAFNYYPVIVTGNTAAIYPHGGVMASNQTYYVLVDDGAFTDSSGAFFAGIASNAWQFATKTTGPANPTNPIVAADGSGDFVTVQGAVDSIPLNNSNYTRINIKNGTYTEIVDISSKNQITFRGQNRTNTVVGYPNNANIAPGGTTHARMAFKVNSKNIAIENMTVTNMTPQGGSQAEAVMIETGASQCILNNAEVDSRQDTLLANVNSSQAYIYNSLITGNFDFIWGGGNLFLTNCEIRTITGTGTPNLVAPRTDNGATGNWPGYSGLLVSNGFSFINCQLTRQNSTVTNCTMSDGNGTLNGLAAFINCVIDTGCYTNALAAATNSYLLWEYGCSNLANALLTNTASPFLGFTQLNNGSSNLVAASSATIWLNGWVPQLAPNILNQPISQSVNAGQAASFTVVATGVPDPTYQWIHNGTNVATGGNAAMLAISNPQAGDIGSYAVIVTTPAGSVTSSVVTLTVYLPPVAGFTTLGVPENTPVSVSIAKILAAAYSPDSNAFGLTAVSPTSEEGGTVVTNSTALTYSPPTNYVGADSFTYTLTDILGNSSVATVSVGVASTNNPGKNQVGNIVMVGGDPQVTFAGIPGYTYSIQRTPSLSSPAWVTVGSVTASPTGQIVFLDTSPLMGQAYYRTTYP